jgi:hypothetical protein
VARGTIIPEATATMHEASNLPQLNTELLMRTLHQAGFFKMWVGVLGGGNVAVD